MDAITETNPAPIIFEKSISTLLANGGHGEIVHILCLKGAISFLFQETLYNIGPNDYVILPNVSLARAFNESSDFEGIVMALDGRFVTALALRSNYGVIGQLSLLQNPVMKLSGHDFNVCLDAMRNLRARLADDGHIFREEMLQHLLMAHILDLYDIHARSHAHAKVPQRAAELMERFIRLLYGGEHLRCRDLSHYASLLCITPHYLTEISKKASGKPATYWIGRFTLHEVTKLLTRKEMPLSEVAERLNFASLSYFSRYVQKHLGMPPSAFRNRK